MHFTATHSVNDRTCHECGSECRLTYEITPFIVKGDKEGFTYDRPILTCRNEDCGEEFVAAEDVKESHDAYCKSEGRLTPAEIKTIREIFGENYAKGKISQRNFSLKLGMGTATIARYELGLQIPSKVHDFLLRACRKWDDFNDLLNEGDLDKSEVITPTDNTEHFNKSNLRDFASPTSIKRADINNKNHQSVLGLH